MIIHLKESRLLAIVNSVLTLFYTLASTTSRPAPYSVGLFHVPSTSPPAIVSATTRGSSAPASGFIKNRHTIAIRNVRLRAGLPADNAGVQRPFVDHNASQIKSTIYDGSRGSYLTSHTFPTEFTRKNTNATLWPYAH